MKWESGTKSIPNGQYNTNINMPLSHICRTLCILLTFPHLVRTIQGRHGCSHLTDEGTEALGITAVMVEPRPVVAQSWPQSGGPNPLARPGASLLPASVAAVARGSVLGIGFFWVGLFLLSYSCGLQPGKGLGRARWQEWWQMWPVASDQLNLNLGSTANCVSPGRLCNPGRLQAPHLSVGDENGVSALCPGSSLLQEHPSHLAHPGVNSDASSAGSFSWPSFQTDPSLPPWCPGNPYFLSSALWGLQCARHRAGLGGCDTGPCSQELAHTPRGEADIKMQGQGLPW